MKKRLLVLCVLLVTMMVSFAVDKDYTAQADQLKALGLFNGTDKGYELDRVPNRVEGAVMLVRLLGKESQAKEKQYSHPFKDVPAWASDHIGYMYQMGLTKGVTAMSFDSYAPLSGNAYATFALRALGYDDKAGDFKWDQALAAAQAKGIITTFEMDSMLSTFKRNEMVGISSNTLSSSLKNGSQTLLQQLVKQGSVKASVAASSGLLEGQECNSLKIQVFSDIGSGPMGHYKRVVMNIDQAAEFMKAAAYVTVTGDVKPRNEYENYLFIQKNLKEHKKNVALMHQADFKAGAHIGLYKNSINVLNFYNDKKERIAFATFIGFDDGNYVADLYNVNDITGYPNKPLDFDKVVRPINEVSLPKGVEIVVEKGGGIYNNLAVINSDEVRKQLPTCEYITAYSLRDEYQELSKLYYALTLVPNKNSLTQLEAGQTMGSMAYMYTNDTPILVLFYDKDLKEIARSVVQKKDFTTDHPQVKALTGKLLKGNGLKPGDYTIERHIKGVKDDTYTPPIYGAGTWGDAGDYVYFSTSPFFIPEGTELKLISHQAYFIVD